MKKLFALMLSIAMVVSMFSGVAFAAPDPIAAKINLTTESAILSGNTYATTTVSGTVTTENNALINAAFPILAEQNTWVYDEIAEAWGWEWITVYEGTATAGRFSFLVETNLTYATTIRVSVDPAFAGYTFEDTYANFHLLFNVATSTLEFNYSETQEVVMGTVKYADNSVPAEEAIYLYWLEDGIPVGDAIAWSAINPTTGSFGFIVNGWGGNSGAIGLVIDGLVHKTGMVNPKALTLTVDPNANIPHTVQNTEITVEFVGPKVDEEPAVSDYFTYNVKKGTKVLLSGTLDSEADGEYEFSFTSNFAGADFKAGTYTVTVWNDIYKGTATFVVVNPARFTLTNTTKLEGLDIGPNAIEFGGDFGIRLYEVDFAGNVVTTNFQYTLYVNGTKSTDVDKDASGTHTYIATEFGSVDLRIVVNRPVENSPVVFDRTFTVPIDGYALTIDKTTITVNQEVTVSVTVKDKNGVGVNNAQVELLGASIDETIYPGDLNIQGGVYAFEIEPTAVGDIKVTVWDNDGVKMAENAEAIAVVGDKVYTVTSDIGTLLAGKTETGTFHVMEGTNKILPEELEVWVDGKYHGTLVATPVDTTGDGLADAVEADVLAHCAEKPAVIRASNATGTKIGDFALTIVSPELVVTGNENVTTFIKTDLVFEVIDPRDGSTLEADVTLEVSDDEYFCDGFHLWIEDMLVDSWSDSERIFFDGDEFEVTVRVNDVFWEDAEDDEEEVTLNVVVHLDAPVAVNGNFPVKEASLVSDPDKILVGVPNNLTFTYTDGNDNPIVGKDVWLYDTETLIGETDANGQVFYALAQGSTLPVTIAADTDNGCSRRLILTVIPVGFDMEAPVVTAPASVTTSTAIITITDNTRVHRLMVNGVEVNIFPMQTVNHIVSVNTGTNVFNVAAMDNFYNVVQTTVTIVKAAPTGSVLTTVIGQTGYTIGGVTTPTDAALMYNANGDSMMPVRFLEAFGAVITWDQTAGAATFVYGGKTVVVTVGSNVAMVNGVAVNMIGASGQAAPAQLVGGRVMVPTRFVSEQLGFTVSWAPPNTVTITAP